MVGTPVAGRVMGPVGGAGPREVVAGVGAGEGGASGGRSAYNTWNCLKFSGCWSACTHLDIAWGAGGCPEGDEMMRGIGVPPPPSKCVLPLTTQGGATVAAPTGDPTSCSAASVAIRDQYASLQPGAGTPPEDSDSVTRPRPNPKRPWDQLCVNATGFASIYEGRSCMWAKRSNGPDGWTTLGLEPCLLTEEYTLDTSSRLD